MRLVAARLASEVAAAIVVVLAVFAHKALVACPGLDWVPSTLVLADNHRFLSACLGTSLKATTASMLNQPLAVLGEGLLAPTPESSHRQGR